jgi:hypothetical protein
LHFACEGWWIGDMYSYISGKPGNLFIEVLDDAKWSSLLKKIIKNYTRKFQN